MRQLYKRLKSVIVHYKADISLRELLTILVLKLQLMKGLVDDTIQRMYFQHILVIEASRTLMCQVLDNISLSLEAKHTYKIH